VSRLATSAAGRFVLVRTTPFAVVLAGDLEPPAFLHIYQLVDEGKASRQQIADLFGIDRSPIGDLAEFFDETAPVQIKPQKFPAGSRDTKCQI
jgi:hypothetical protein